MTGGKVNGGQMADQGQAQGGGTATADQNQGQNNAGAGGQSTNNGQQGQHQTGQGQGSNGGSDAGQQNQGFDFSKLSDSDWDGIFKHDRFKSLREKASKADELTAQQEAAETKRLEEAGEHQKLAEGYKTQLAEAQSTIKNMQINAAVQAAAVKAGITDLDAAQKLVDAGAIQVDKNGNVTGAEAAVTALVEARPYLVQSNNNGTQRLGSGGGNQAGDGQGGPQTFTVAQISDPAFYRERQKEIDEAAKAGRITQ